MESGTRVQATYSGSNWPKDKPRFWRIAKSVTENGHRRHGVRIGQNFDHSSASEGPSIKIFRGRFSSIAGQREAARRRMMADRKKGNRCGRSDMSSFVDYARFLAS